METAINNESKCILLLEDEFIVRGGMKALIQMAEPQAQIYEASSYEEAVNLLINRKFDLAFLDYELKTSFTGLDVLHFIREHEISTFAVMLSGRDDRETVRACLDAGACGYIPKGIDQKVVNTCYTEDIFKKAIETVLGGCLYLPASVFGRGGYSPLSSLPHQAVSVDKLGLSPRQTEVLYYICQGLPNKAIAKKMDISENTVRKDYVTGIFRSFKVSRRTELVIEVSRRGIKIPKPTSC